MTENCSYIYQLDFLIYQLLKTKEDFDFLLEHPVRKS